MKLTNKQYDFIRDFAFLFPLLCVLVIAVLHIWNVPYATPIEMTLAAVEAFVGSFAKWARERYMMEHGEEVSDSENEVE